jgi:acetoin utilization deacetylase AcuC-like enzyme
MELVSSSALAELHPTGAHPERRERLAALLAAAGGYVEGREATLEEIERVHDASYVERVSLIDAETWLDDDTVAGPTTWQAARLAAGSACVAAEIGGLALVRPPGHHALRDRAMGFCILNNVAIAARHAQAVLGIERVAIVDIDVHHGNGTEEIFRHDDTVLFVSLHQWPFYPGTGGPGTSDATTLNIPLAPGAGDAEYAEAFSSVVEPAVAAFAPDLVLVSQGFDAHVDDPLAAMTLTADGFRDLARRCAGLAPRVSAVLEGGYNVETLPALLAAAREGFELQV